MIRDFKCFAELNLRTTWPQTLICIDLDYTLIVPRHPLGDPRNQALLEQVLRTVGPAHERTIQQAVLPRLLDKTAVSWLSRYRECAIGLTARTVADPALFRVLREQHLNFQSRHFGKASLTLEPVARGRPPPILTKSVLFTAGNPKGEVLARCVRQFTQCASATEGAKKLGIRQVILIDDVVDNLCEMRSACESLGVAFLGFRATAAQDREWKPSDLLLKNVADRNWLLEHFARHAGGGASKAIAMATQSSAESRAGSGDGSSARRT